MKKIAALILLLLAVIIVPVSAGEEWTKTLGEEITAVATDEYGDRIFVGTEGGMVYCYDSAGSVVWSSTPAGTGEISKLLASESGEAVVALKSNHASYINGDTGVTIWSRPASTITMLTCRATDL